MSGRVLVIQTAWYGDLMLTTPLIRAVKRGWPEAEVTVLVRADAAALLVGNPHLTRLIPYDKRGSERGIFSVLKRARGVRRAGFELVLCPHRSLRSALLARASGAPRRVGFTTTSAPWLFTDRVEPEGDHEVDRNLSLLAPLGLEPAGRKPELFPDQADRQVVEAFLCRLGWRERTFAAIAPGSIWHTKRWPPVHYVRLIQRLNEEWPVVLVGGPADRSVAAAILARLGQPPERLVADATGQFSLLASAELIGRARLLVSNDSAPVHMASAMETPTLALFGPTVPSMGFGPLTPASKTVGIDLYCRPCTLHGSRRCPQGHFRCMLELSPGWVEREARTLLQGSPSSAPIR